MELVTFIFSILPPTTAVTKSGLVQRPTRMPATNITHKKRRKVASWMPTRGTSRGHRLPQNRDVTVLVPST